MKPEMNTARPVFIIGNRRSGTTLIRLMLTSHPNISIPPEGGFITQLGWRYAGQIFDSPQMVDGYLTELFSLENTQDWELDRDSLRERMLGILPCGYPAIIEEIYKEYSINKYDAAKKRWGDKTTWYMDDLPMIDSLFPQAQFIHIIRDGRAVAASYKNVPHLPKDIKEVAPEWRWRVSSVQKFGRRIGAGRYFEFRYEDLTTNPEDALLHICDFLGEEYSPEMLLFWKKNMENQLEPERHMGWKKLTLQEVTNDQISKWTKILSREEVMLFQVIAGEQLSRLGYNDVPYPEIPLAIKLQGLWTGVSKLVYWNMKSIARPVVKKLRLYFSAF